MKLDEVNYEKNTVFEKKNYFKLKDAYDYADFEMTWKRRAICGVFFFGSAYVGF